MSILLLCSIHFEYQVLLTCSILCWFLEKNRFVFVRGFISLAIVLVLITKMTLNSIGTSLPGTSASFLEQLQLLSNINTNNDMDTEMNSNELKARLNYYMTDKKAFKDHKYYKKRDDNNRPFLLTINDIFTSSLNMKATKALLSLAKISNENSDLAFSHESKHETSDNIDYFFRSVPLDLSKNGMDDDNDNNCNNLKLANITCVKTPVVLSSMSSNTTTLTPISLLEPKVEITCDSDLLQN